ncbi:expressed unknown protein [Seminavis robusta]|uniref:Uncharacterized protein n=1 Tax=Seminavis robusta TaxID=568900 RepID=A0A9N8ENF4_9STRA|nr:expressed unknown protein [Seminavis robusta]|eukprot:Sro1282_g259030.1 n/a (919) ;mRNA; f:27195-30074
MKKRGVRRSVSFNEAGPTIQRIDSVRCLLLLAADNDKSNNTDNEEEMEANFLNEIWYDKMEIASQKEENAELVLELDNKNNGDDDTNNNKEEPHDATLRGLERQTEEGSWQAFQNRNKALEAVLDTKPQNDEELASLSSQATQDAKRVAQQRALQDEKEAQEYLQDVRTSILNGSIHSMLSMGTAGGGGSAHSMPFLSMEDLHDNDDNDTDDDDDDATFASESDGEASLGFEDTAASDNKPTKKQGKTKVKKKVQRVKSLPTPNIPALGDAHHDDDDDEEDSILSPFASGAKKLRDARKRLSAETPNKKKKAMELGHKSDTALMDDDSSSSSNSDNTPPPTSFSSLKNKTTTMRRAKSLGTATSKKEDSLATTKKKKTATKKTKTTASKTITTTTNSAASPLTRLQRCKSAPMPKAPTPAEEIAALLSDVSNTSDEQGPMMDDDSSRTSIRIRVSKMNQNPTPPPFDFSKKKTTTRTKAQQSQRASLPATALYQWKDHFPKGSTTTNSSDSDDDDEDPKMSVSASAADYQWQEHSEEQRDDNTAKQVSSSSSAKSLQLLQQEQAKLNAKKAKMEAYAKKHHDDDDNNNNNNKEEEPPPKRVLPIDNFNIDPSMLPRRKNKKSPGLKRSNTLEGDKPKQQRAGTLDRPKAPRRTKSAASKKAMLGGEMPLRSKSQGKKGGLSGGLAKFVMKTQQIEQKREAAQVTKQPEDSSDDDDDDEENVPKNKRVTAKKDVALPKKLEKQQETEAKQPAVVDAGGGESDDDESDCDSPDEDAPTRRSTFTGSLACLVTGDYAVAENDKKEEEDTKPQQRASTGSIPKTKKAESTTEENTAPKSRAVPARSKSASKKAMLLPTNGSRTGGRKLPERSSSMGNPASAKRNKFPSNGKRASVQRIPRRKGAATGSEDSEPVSRANSSVN